jgi:hypothetical protein
MPLPGKPPRKLVKAKPGTFQFRAFAEVADVEQRSVTARINADAKRSRADSLLRKFSWEKDNS